MTVPDVNVLICAMDANSSHHEPARAWWASPVKDTGHLAAVAIENGGTVYSADDDFSRFDRVSWVNPLTSVE